MGVQDQWLCQGTVSNQACSARDVKVRERGWGGKIHWSHFPWQAKPRAYHRGNRSPCRFLSQRLYDHKTCKRRSDGVLCNGQPEAGKPARPVQWSRPQLMRVCYKTVGFWGDHSLTEGVTEKCLYKWAPSVLIRILKRSFLFFSMYVAEYTLYLQWFTFFPGASLYPLILLVSTGPDLFVVTAVQPFTDYYSSQLYKKLIRYHSWKWP